MQSRKFLLFHLMLAVTFLLTACGGANNPTQTVTPSALAATETTVPATATPTPAATKVWVVLGGAMPTAQIAPILVTLQGLCDQAGYLLEQKPTASKEELTAQAATLRMVVILPPDPGFADWAASFPAISFLTVNLAASSNLPNLYQVGTQGNHPEWDAFMGGYIAAVLTNEWRIGMLTQAGSQEGALAADGFKNGGVFYCGLCNPTFPPFIDYPYPMEFNAGATQVEWQPVVDEFIRNGVKTAYIYPGISSPELLLYLAQNGLKLIGSTPPPDGLQPAWLATVQTDLDAPLRSAWADMLAGTSAPASGYPAVLLITNADPTLITPGKMRIFDQISENLASGIINPLTVR